VRRAGAIRAHQNLSAERLRVQLSERQVQHRLVIGGGVRAGVAGPQDARWRLARLIQVGQQRMVAEAAFEVPAGLLLVRVRARQRRVDVDHRQLRALALLAALRAGTQLPRPRPGEGDR
jgi:hypothetical protein